MSELEFLNALHVEMVRHGELRPQAHRHELFQTSTIEALLGGAFHGDVSLSEILQHGDLGLGTLNGLDGELIVIDGQAWKANADCTLIRAPGLSRTPYAVVVLFAPAPPIALRGPLAYAALGQALGHRLEGTTRPVAVRIDGRFAHIRVRSVRRQRHPYPSLAEALAEQRISDLDEVSDGLAAKFSRMPSRNVVLGRSGPGVPWARWPVSCQLNVSPSSLDLATHSSASVEPWALKAATETNRLPSALISG